MGEIPGDIGEQLTALKAVAEDIDTVRKLDALVADMGAERRTTPCAHEDYEPGSVTYTEIYDGEGFRPFG